MKGKIRKWGNSYGILIPKKELEKRGLKENQIVDINVNHEPDVRRIFGIIKTNKSVQEIKDEMCEGHDDEILL